MLDWEKLVECHKALEAANILTKINAKPSKVIGLAFFLTLRDAWVFPSNLFIYPQLPSRRSLFHEQYRKDAQVAHKSSKVSMVCLLY
ncbi:hypothetical protein EDD57_15613 [Baia soyae]|uniref:Uncharacterized protein n=1 Tax=Baia soyae TaxID=1544746 RepID=A0A4R2RF12_9BACL|nr:hypothetical protein EDD57_15613 [Baia soyae]